MPFSRRIVNPPRIGRLSDAEKKTVADAGEFLAVSHCALVGILQQLTSVTKHADGIFSDLCEECRVVLARTDAIRKRCDAISGIVEKFNHKTEKLPQGDLARISKNPSHHYHHHVKLDKELVTNQTRPECVQDQYDAAVIDRVEVRRIHEEYREKDGLIWEQEFQKGSASDLDEKIPNLDIETRKPAILGLLERDKQDRESPWIRPRSADMLCFMKDNTNVDDLPLPTPEEALRRNAKSQPSVLIPVDITGTTFNRMCEFRRSLRGSMEYEQRKSRKRRRRTVSGIPGEVSRELDDMGFGLSADGPTTIERSKTLDFEANGDNNSLLDFRISRHDLHYSRDEVFSDSPERDEVKRGPGDHSVHAPERHEKRSLRGSFRNLSCLGNRAEARSRQRSTIREREKRSRSLPPDRHKAESSAIMQKEPKPEEPLERTISQETLQSISNQQFNLVRCLSFHKLRRSRSMSGNKDKKEKKRQLSRAKSQDFDTLNSCEYKTNDKKQLPLSRAKSQDFDTINTVSKGKNNKKILSRAKSQDFDTINSCGYKSEDDLDHDEGIAVSQENIADSRDNVTARERLSPAERLLKKEKRKSLGKRLSQFWSNVQFRSHGNKKRPSKEDRQSSSGAWSASSDSVRQSSGSAGSGPSPDRSSFKDSALELSVPPPLVETDRVSQKGSIHGSLMDVRRNFTAMDSDAWLKQTLEQRNKTSRTKEIPVKDLTQANLEAHDLRTLTDNGVVIDEEESSEYSVDQEGFYTSMHTDSGLNKRHSMHSVLSGNSAKDATEQTRYMFRSNMTLDSVIYKPKQEDNTIMSEGKSTDTLTAETPGYLSMSVVSKGAEMVPPSVPVPNKSNVDDTLLNKKKVPPPPKRVSTLNQSMSSADDSIESIDGAIAMPPMDSFVTPILMPRSLSANSSLNNSKNTLASTESESDHQHIYARVKMKTAINTSMYPSMCSVTPMGSDDETISLRSESRSDSDFTVSSIATPSPLISSAPSPWSNFKSPYSTIDKYKNLMKQSSIVESTPVAMGGYRSHTLPRKMSFKQFALKETEEEKRKRWSAENKSISSDDSGEHYNSNSWPRSPPFRQKKIAIPTIESSITESKDEAPMIPPKPMIVKSGSNDSLKSNSSGGRGSGDLSSITGKATMKPIPEIKTFSQYQELLKGVSPEQPDGVTAAESMLSLSSSSSQSTGISSMSSGSGSGSEGTVPSKYQHAITVRPKTGNPAQILSPTDRPRMSRLGSIDNQSKVEYIKVREPIYANTSRSGEQRALYANLNNRPSIYANSLAKTNIYANTNTHSHIYSNKPGYANTANIDAEQTSPVNKISPPRPELIYAITNVVKSEATVPKCIEPPAPHYATSNLVKTPPQTTQGATDSAADTSSGYIQMSWPESKVETDLKRVSSFMGSKGKNETNKSDYSTLGSFAVKQDAEKSFKMTEDADKCVVLSQSDEAAPNTSGTMPKPFQPGKFSIGPSTSQNKYATIGKGRKLSIDANTVAGGGKSSSGGPVMSTAALVELARRNSSPSLTTQYNSPLSRQVSVPDTILAEPSSPVEKTSLIDSVQGLTTNSDASSVVSQSESNNNSVLSSPNKNKGRLSLESGLSKSKDSLSSTKSAKARISLDSISKPAPLTELDYLKRMKSLSPGDGQEDLQKSRDSIDEVAVMDILDSIRSTINNINNDKHNEATSEPTSPTAVVTKAPFYGTTV
ncbi:uncharacterized protein LOC135487524 [Lineus longissimus]|uniref:uncharacterized protein LOC135487524 n=1 Tax=Lineus longissimus TaxID=88925 RepID=UPI00315DC3CE